VCSLRARFRLWLRLDRPNWLPFKPALTVSTAAAVCLLTIVWVQRISHRRALNIAVDSIADVLRHDQYSRAVAREAIRRYNDHIESCNRVIEAEQTGLWQWTSSRELAELNEKVETAQAEIKRLEEELETKAAMIAELSLRGNQPLPTTPSSTDPGFRRVGRSHMATGHVRC
jgi:hypothetical protein